MSDGGLASYAFGKTLLFLSFSVFFAIPFGKLQQALLYKSLIVLPQTCFLKNAQISPFRGIFKFSK